MVKASATGDRTIGLWIESLRILAGDRSDRATAKSIRVY
jgi:hypothetical protein